MAENALREERRKLGELEGGDARPADSGERLAGQTGEWWESYYRRIDAIKKHQEKVASGEQPQAYERNPVSWSEFSARVGAEVDAARDAVHRFRQKEDTMSDKERAAAAAVAARLDVATRSAVGQAGATLRAHGTQLRGEVTPQQVGDLARPLTPQGDRANVTQRYRGRTQDGNDSPRMPRVPPETKNAQAIGARLSESARQDAARAGVTLSQQNHATMHERQAPAAARDDTARRAGLADRFAGKDTGLETQRQQAQRKENERER